MIILLSLWPHAHAVLSVSNAFLQLSSWQNCNLPLAIEPHLNAVPSLGPIRTPAGRQYTYCEPCCQDLASFLRSSKGGGWLPLSLQHDSGWSLLSAAILNSTSWRRGSGGAALPSRRAFWSYQPQGRVTLRNGRWPGTNSVLNWSAPFDDFHFCVCFWRSELFGFWRSQH